MSEGFLSRWSRRKNQSRTEDEAQVDDQQADLAPVDLTSNTVSASKLDDAQSQSQPNLAEEAPLPTEEDLAKIEETSDVSAFLQAKVPEALKNQAFKALFKNPKFNHVDMLDVYMEDYNKFVPLTEELRDKMTFAKKLLSRPDLEELESVTEGMEEGSQILATSSQEQDSARAGSDEPEGAEASSNDGDPLEIRAQLEIADSAEAGPRGAPSEELVSSKLGSQALDSQETRSHEVLSSEAASQRSDAPEIASTNRSPK